MQHLMAMTAAFALWSCATGVGRRTAYLLPFDEGVSSKLIQGNNGQWGHTRALAYAFDFILPMGSEVRAARNGKVYEVQGGFADNTRKPGEENYIFVDHLDGTFGRYYHLAQGGVKVHVGQRVRAGDLIGLSGNSGASAGPHLHFDVTRGCPQYGCQTIPIRFANATDPVPVAGKSYSPLRH
jgi:murein DD-endopeptidase MepM/ murein hydrolase activator NlpD